MSTDSEKSTFENIKNWVSPFLNFIVTIDKEGLEQIPTDTGAILVGNHRSDMDPFIVASAVPRYISWIAAEYVQKIPLFKNLISETGVIPMDISGNVSVSSIKRILKVLKDGDLLGIFPEGHDYMVQNDFSAPMTPWHSGFGVFAKKGRVPIVPFAIIPIEEDIESIPFPPQVRHLIGLPEEVCNIPLRTTYKHVKIIFAEKIPYEEFKNMPEKEASQYLTRICTERITEIMFKEGMLLREQISEPISSS